MWTTEQCQGLLERYWRIGTAACPTCGSVVRVTYVPFMIDYLLVAVCPEGCGELRASLANDLTRERFRAWLAQEAADIIRDHLAGTATRCPVDGAMVDVAMEDHRGVQFVAARCRRCRRGFETSGEDADLLSRAAMAPAAMALPNNPLVPAT